MLGKNYFRLDIVISFLAILELIKGGFIKVIQTEVFEDIKLIRIKEITEIRKFGLMNLEL